MRPSWISQADPESNDKDPDSRQKRRHKQERGETMVVEAKIGGSHTGILRAPGAGKKRFSSRPFGRRAALLTLIPDFWPPKPWENTFLLFLSLQIYGNLLPWPEDLARTFRWEVWIAKSWWEGIDMEVRGITAALLENNLPHLWNHCSCGHIWKSLLLKMESWMKIRILFN